MTADKNSMRLGYGVIWPPRLCQLLSSSPRVGAIHGSGRIAFTQSANDGKKPRLRGRRRSPIHLTGTIRPVESTMVEPNICSVMTIPSAWWRSAACRKSVMIIFLIRRAVSKSAHEAVWRKGKPISALGCRIWSNSLQKRLVILQAPPPPIVQDDAIWSRLRFSRRWIILHFVRGGQSHISLGFTLWDPCTTPCRSDTKMEPRRKCEIPERVAIRELQIVNATSQRHLAGEECWHRRRAADHDARVGPQRSGNGADRVRLALLVPPLK